jgi:hypothetical protein
MGKTKKLLITTATVAAVAGTLHIARRSAGGSGDPQVPSPEPYPPGPYRGGRNSRTVHVRECRYTDTKKPARVFDSIQSALDAGYRPCKICLG